MRLIDADALNAAFLDYPKTLTFNGGFCAVNLDAVLLEIRRAPTIEAEPVRHGRVITVTDKWKMMYQKCSECGETLEWRAYPNYCPNCGARMDGGADDDPQG